MFYLAIFALNILGLSPVALTENILLLRIFSQCSLRLFITAGMDCLIWPQPELKGKQPGKGKIWKGANTIAIHQFQSIPNSSCGVWHMTIWRRSDMGSPIKKEDWEVILTSFVKEDIASIPVLLYSETGQGLILSDFTTHTTVGKSGLHSAHTHLSTCSLRFSWSFNIWVF